jgi:glycosyltransferase involved in cell wall biosynthesis
MIDNAGISDLIELRGYREDIAKELAELDLLIIPSLAEPFGRILCEAAEAQVPVLLANSGGLGELSRRFEVGVRFEANNVDDLLRQLNHMVGNREKVRQDFEMSATRLLNALNMESYIRIIEDIIRDSAFGRPTAVSWFGVTRDAGRNSSTLSEIEPC